MKTHPDLIYVSFVAAETPELSFLDNLELRIEKQETLCLKSFGELCLLLSFFDTSLSNSLLPKIQDVENSWVISSNLKIHSNKEFELFYQEWLKTTERENHMDEYGQLLYLNAFAPKLNKAKYKLVLRESIESMTKVA